VAQSREHWTTTFLEFTINVKGALFMTPEAFEKQMLELKYRKPFLPFVAVLSDGRRIVIESPAIVFNPPAVGIISESDGLVSFLCTEVQKLEFLVSETVA
jgi:hypothetical protein